jgi:hypothetical protein
VEEKDTSTRAPGNHTSSTGKVYGDKHQEHVFEEHEPVDETSETERRKHAGEAQG